MVAKIQKSNIKMQKFNREVRSQKSKYRIPSQPQKESLNHKEHKDFLFVFLLNPKSQILNPNLSVCFLIFNILFPKKEDI